MSFASRLLWIGVLGIGLTSATVVQAANQLYRVADVSWTVKAFGNECAASRTGTTGGTAMLDKYPHCDALRSGESEFYSAVGLPQGIQCNAFFPRCPFMSTPTDGAGNFAPLGGSQMQALFCAPWYDWGGKGTAVRPAKGMTATTGGKNERLIPPLYRNPAFFTASGAAGTTVCTAASTGFTPGGKGRVQAGNPITGALLVSGTGGAKGGFSFPAAGVSPWRGELRASGVAGEFYGIYGDPAGYTYTYATLRNAYGIFRPASGLGSFNIKHRQGIKTNASINVKQGAARFGGVMRMLGALTSKVCYPHAGGCSRGTPNWLYDAIGVSVYTTLGSPITQGYQVYGTAMFFNSGLGVFSTLRIEGSRFSWTTGSVTVTAKGRGPHKTVHYAHGYDNRSTTLTGYPFPRQAGTIQLVTPVLTRWIQPAATYETVGIGILRFAPEPHAWAMLAAGVAFLGVGYRLRKPASAARDGR